LSRWAQEIRSGDEFSPIFLKDELKTIKNHQNDIKMIVMDNLIFPLDNTNRVMFVKIHFTILEKNMITRSYK